MRRQLTITGPSSIEPYNKRNEAEAALSADLPSSAWTQGEFALAAGDPVVRPQERIVTVPIPSYLHYRKCYLYRQIVLNGITTQYRIDMQLSFRRNGRVVAVLPCSSTNVPNALGALAGDSCPSMFTQNSTPVGADSLELTLSWRMTDDGATGSNNERAVLLTPMRTIAPGDEVTLDVLGVSVDAGSVDNLRVWIGILSSDRAL